MPDKVAEQVAECLARFAEDLGARLAAAKGVKRQELSEATKREHVNTVERFFGGRCPCCQSVEIVRGGQRLAVAAFDHKTGNRAKAGPHETWLVCSPCNAAFERPEYDQRKRDVAFAFFQLRREETTQHQLRLI